MPLFQQPFMSGGFPSMNRAAGAIGGWVELGRTTLGASGDTISVSSLADKRYYMILGDLQDTGGNINTLLRFNSDSGTNYAYRYSDDGGTDSALTSQGDARIWIPEQSAPVFHVGYIANRSANEKLLLSHSVTEEAAGEATAPSRIEFAGKWDNTSDPIDEITMTNSKAGSYNTGSEVVVLGWDPDDTHTNNFWEELASVNASGSSTTLSSGTITAKKYLWIQYYLEPASSDYPELTFNNDTGTNYARRISDDGGADATAGSQVAALTAPSGTTPLFANIFVINNTSNEKLLISHVIQQNTAGAATAPARREGVFKWDNTAAQITEIDLDTNGGANWNSNSILKVWGAN